MLYRLINTITRKPVTKLTELANIAALGTLDQATELQKLEHMQVYRLPQGRAIQAVDERRLAELITHERYGSVDAVAGQKHPFEDIP